MSEKETNLEELYAKASDYFDADRYKEATDLFFEAYRCGEEDALAMATMSMYLNALQCFESADEAENAEDVLSISKQTMQQLNTCIKMSLQYMAQHPTDISDCSAVGAVLINSFAQLYSIANNGLSTGWRITEDGNKVTDINELGGILFVEYEKYHEEYVSLTNDRYAVFGLSDKEKQTMEAEREVLENAAVAASILELLGRDYDAMLLRARMALMKADGHNGDKLHLLAAEWFYNNAKTMAKKAFTDKDDLDEWNDNNVDTMDQYKSMHKTYKGVMAGYIKEGKKPPLRLYYTKDDVIPDPADDQGFADAMDDIEGFADSKSILLNTLLVIFDDMDFMKMVPIFAFCSVSGLFLGGLPAINRARGFVHIFGLVWFLVTMVFTFIRSLTNGAGITSGMTKMLFILVMMLLALMLNTWYIPTVILFAAFKFGLSFIEG